MRLRQVILHNFRPYNRDTRISIDDFTALVGRNDIGKSCVLEALDIFFNGGTSDVDASDLSVDANEKYIRVGCVFDDLPAEIVLDANAPTTLEAEWLLNTEGRLEIWKEWDCTGAKPKKPSVSARAVHPTANGAFDLLQLKNTELKARLQQLGVADGNVDQRTNRDLRRAIWAATADLLVQESSVPLDEQDGKKIWETLQKRLPIYALFRADRSSDDGDSEIQDPMRVSIREGLARVPGALDEVKRAIEDAALETANRTLEKVRELDPTLAGRLTPRFPDEPAWERAFKLILDGDAGIPLNKRGSGARRLILLSFFRAEAEKRLAQATDSDGIIYAIEEPETSQHPAYQKLLIKAFLGLAAAGTQVIVTTHNPAIASLVPIETVRHVKRTTAGLVVEMQADNVWEEVATELGVLPDSRVRAIVCVEGSNDITALGHLSALLHNADQNIPDLKSLKSIAVLPLSGSNLRQWVEAHYLGGLNKPEAHFYDRDADTPPKYADAAARVNARGDGSFATITSKLELENYLHPDAIQTALNCTVAFGDNDDVPALVAKAVHEGSVGAQPWVSLQPDRVAEKVKRAKRRLNDDAAAEMTLEQLRERDPNSELEGWLRRLGALLDRA